MVRFRAFQHTKSCSKQSLTLVKRRDRSQIRAPSLATTKLLPSRLQKKSSGRTLHQGGASSISARAPVARTDDPDAARELVTILDWNKYFPYQEIYPGCKITHFKRFHQQTGLPYKQMLFFDDELRNIHDVSTLGVTCIHAQRGMSHGHLEQGLRRFQEQA
ncbi:magnesium-dependent phosphatase 1 isoform X2 [Ixodes scapularis]|uniref:magnesium-dependent phosphatase 1 isoform X2 n=1 Tax=Ixodes scapularis TaxID=6945 RepID=UPI001A9F78D2|nr:magnesium-dependent phosphatase 1 isoform X2 [Ixodes scapularis]